MTQTERQRIEKEAHRIANHLCAPNETEKYHDIYTGAVAGALAEHEKARNQAIDECIQIFKDEFSLSGEDVDSEDWILTKKLEQLKTKP